MAKNVFLNYRREDSSGSSGRIFDQLSQKLKGVKIFMDVNALEPGVDFGHALNDQLAGCDYFIAVVGPNWIGARSADGRRRLDDPKDYVRLEIEAALERGIRVVPVLVDGAQMPQPDELPQTLRPFCMRNAVVVAHHKFAGDVADLAGAIMRNLGLEAQTSRADGPRHSAPSWADIVLSFQGRLSRKAFWAWNAALLPIVLILQQLLLLVIGGSLADFFTADHQPVPLQYHLITQIGTLPVWWCFLALTAKRLHDFNAGWGFLAAFIGLSVVFLGGVFLDSILYVDESRRETKDVIMFHGLVSGVAILYSAIWIAIGCVPGTPGPNRYGPD